MREQERSQPARERGSAYRMPEVKASARLLDGHAAAAFLSYLAISVLVFGRGALAHPATVCFVGPKLGIRRYMLVFGLVGSTPFHMG